MYIYIPFGFICLLIAFVTFYKFNKALRNKKINRHNNYQEKLLETLLTLKKSKVQKEQVDAENGNGKKNISP